MLRFRCCPKCRGDVMLDKDYYGWYEQCLQCGFLRDLEIIAQVGQQPASSQPETKEKRGKLLLAA
jgi:hypothetical protein